MDRRNFLATGAAAMALTPTDLLFGADKNDPFVKKIGIQLYTLRNQIAKDVRGRSKQSPPQDTSRWNPMDSPMLMP